MPPSREAIRSRNRRNRRAVYVGAAVTALSTFAFFLLPDLLPVYDVRMWIYHRTDVLVGGPSDNPFAPLRVFGSVIGGGVAGWLTADRSYGAVTGLKATSYGLALAAALVSIGTALYWMLVLKIVPPPVYDVVVIPLMYAATLFPIYLIVGGVVGAIGHRARKRVSELIDA